MFPVLTSSQLLSIAEEIQQRKSGVGIRAHFKKLLDSSQIPIVDGQRLARDAGCFIESKPIVDQHKCALRLVDRFFDSLVMAYPQRVRKDVNAAYYKGTYTQLASSLLEKDQVWGSVSFLNIMGSQGAAQGALALFRVQDQAYMPVVQIDAELPPLVQKLILIHEVGVHLGQSFVLEMVGDKAKDNRPTWASYTELSAFTVSKDISDLIPYKVMEYDFSLQPLFSGRREKIKSNLLAEWKIPKGTFGWLMVSAYQGLNLSMDEARLFETKYRSVQRSLSGY